MPSRRELVIAASMTVALLVLGVVLGLIWYWLAPTELSVVLRDGTTTPLPTESEHLFDGLAIFLLMGFGAGVVSASAVWQWRAHRGPVLSVAVVLVSLLSAWVAYWYGIHLAVAPQSPGPAGSLVALPPVLDSASVIVAQPFGAALALLVVASFNGHDNLGRSAEPPGAEPTSAPGGELNSGMASS